MFGEVKLGEADYTVHCYLCQISWKGPFDAYSLFKAMSNILERAFWCLQPFQGFLLLENAKNIHHKCFCGEYDKTRDLC